MPAKTTKPSAASRTISMFATVQPAEAPVEAAPEDAPPEERAEFQPMEVRAEGYRDNAFKLQEWTSKVFGVPDGDGNEYRVTRANGYFYLEELKESEGGKSFYGYAGLMLSEKNFLKAVRVLAQAAREYAK